MTNYHEQNRKSWNNATKQHHSHKPDLIERHKNGWNNLHDDDMNLLGKIKGKTVAHLQCNDGQDTISIAKFCGAEVTGIDISDYAIESAKSSQKRQRLQQILCGAIFSIGSIRMKYYMMWSIPPMARLIG
jgi:2-polyprenyl-3-methyl-5-hydroxy-6-metoxy-1,4-benzoquinol methylase